MQSYYLFRVEFVELSFAIVLAPQAQDLCLRTVRHVDQLFKPPTITDGAVDATED